jgi:DNA-binding transcriptional LysR family regulator
MLDRVTGLQVFARVAASGSLSAAARAMSMSQTMATKHMAALEDRLGTKLLYRTTRRISLTEAGRAYLDSIERILTDLEEADALATAATVEARGTLRFNVPVSFGIREIAPLLPELTRRHPMLTIDLGLNDRQVDLIEEGWDLAVRIGAMKDSGLIARRLAPCKMLVCAAPRYLAEYGIPRTIAELEHHICLGYTLSQSVGADRWSFGVDGSRRVSVQGPLKANNGDALVAAAIAGQGITYQPIFLVRREIAAGQLVALTLDAPTLDLSGVYAIYPAARRPPAKVRVVIDFLAEMFGSVPPWER